MRTRHDDNQRPLPALTWITILAVVCQATALQAQSATSSSTDYQQLRAAFVSPDHARWGEVPLWWWEGDRLSRPRLTWQLETLARAGVKSVCPIQRSPGRCDPPSFSPEWWELFAFVHSECVRLGMSLWAYDQVGYGHYGWLEKAAAQVGSAHTQRIHFVQADGQAPQPMQLQLPAGTIIGARAYPLRNAGVDDAQSIDISQAVSGSQLQWTPPDGAWRVAVAIAVDDVVFQLNPAAGDRFIDMLYGEIERRVGRAAMGQSFAGVFQDEHPPTPRDIYTEQLAARFTQRCGYDIDRAIPALHFDVGPLTPKYRTDFLDAYLSLDEECYWKRVYDWIAQRNLLTSHDNWGRQNIDQQSFAYIDYFRTQRWFSSPGFDDAGSEPVARRNYYDTKIAASIARLYQRPRVWAEDFHSSGWGRTTDQTLSWLSANYVFGANLYNEHGLYYSNRANTWEHAAPDPHWQQPYWCYYHTLSDWVARTSYLMSQGTHVVDVAVHYPVASLLAGDPPDEERPDYNIFMQISRALFDAAIDNDIIDDDSILSASLHNGQLIAGGNPYQALVFAPQPTVRRAVLEQAIALAEGGGIVAFVGRLPSATTDAGRADPQLPQLLERLFGESLTQLNRPAGTVRKTAAGGLVIFAPGELEQVTLLLREHLSRDFATDTEGVVVAHRRIGDVHAFLVQNATDAPVELDARCRVHGIPEIWDAFSGEVRPVDWFERREGVTVVQHRLVGNIAQLIVFRPADAQPSRDGQPGDQQQSASPGGLLQPADLELALPEAWTFSVMPTRDNHWGEFRWPPSDELIGPEIRSFRYAEGTAQAGLEAGWNRPDFDDSDWPLARYSIGPYWLCLADIPAGTPLPAQLLTKEHGIAARVPAAWAGNASHWQPVEYSQKIGLARPVPWGGHSGYPDGAIDQEFLDLPAGRKLLFTRLCVPQPQRLGLRVALRNTSARLWVNGVEQPFEDAVGNLPLEAGENDVLLELPDGGRGMLFVEREPPAARTLAEAARRHPAPDLGDAFWIRGSDPAAGYLRRTFELDEVPSDARLVATGYSGYQLFINGHKVHEEIGPWAQWTHPESLNVTRYLRAGRNVIAAWVQAFAGQNVHAEADMKALGCVLAVRYRDGRDLALISDGTWRAAAREQEHWQDLDFDDTAWKPASVLARMGAEPWGRAPLENQGLVTEPRRALSIDLPSPYLTCFDAVPEVVYDIKPSAAERSGWFRFLAPPGLKTLTLHTDVPAQVWVDGQPVQIQEGVASLPCPAESTSTVAVRLDMRGGAYGGAAFPLPLSVELAEGKIQPGLWADMGLPTYSGIGVYRQTFQCTAEQIGRRTILDLGQVLVAAEVFVNGRSAGVRLARPFSFDVTHLLRSGPNALEIRVANTIAPHYTVTNHSDNLGPTDSGLLGPVTLRQELPWDEWRDWAESEIDRLTEILTTSTPELVTAQRAWEARPGWSHLECLTGDPQTSTTGGDSTEPQATDLRVAGPLKYRSDLTGITALRLELPAAWPAAGEAATDLSLPHHLSLVARRVDGQPYCGRYVRIEIPDRSEFLHLAEVQVLQGHTNLALQKPARQSSTTLDAVAAHAVDGNTDGSWGGDSVTHTNFELNPWWEVDLGSLEPISCVVIHNRTDGELEDRLSDFRVTLYDDARQVVWQQQVATRPQPSLRLDLSPMQVVFAQPFLDWGAAQQLPGAQDGARQVAIMQLRHSAGFPQGTLLELTLQSHDPMPPGLASSVRLSATTAQPPCGDLPPSLVPILETTEDQRAAEQQEALSAFYRSIAPELQPIRERLSRLRHQLTRQAAGVGEPAASE